MPFHIFTI